MPLTNHNYRGQGYGSEGTIVVNNGNHWAQVSSPESSPEPETEPIVATLLARFKRAPNLDLVSPEPEEREEEQLPAYTVVESEEDKRRSSQNSALRLSRISGVRTSEERLQEMPKLRELPVGISTFLTSTMICQPIATYLVVFHPVDYIYQRALLISLIHSGEKELILHLSTKLEESLGGNKFVLGVCWLLVVSFKRLPVLLAPMDEGNSVFALLWSKLAFH